MKCTKDVQELHTKNIWSRTRTSHITMLHNLYALFEVMETIPPKLMNTENDSLDNLNTDQVILAKES